MVKHMSTELANEDGTAGHEASVKTMRLGMTQRLFLFLVPLGLGAPLSAGACAAHLDGTSVHPHDAEHSIGASS